MRMVDVYALTSAQVEALARGLKGADDPAAFAVVDAVKVEADRLAGVRDNGGRHGG